MHTEGGEVSTAVAETTKIGPLHLPAFLRATMEAGLHKGQFNSFTKGLYSGDELWSLNFEEGEDGPYMVVGIEGHRLQPNWYAWFPVLSDNRTYIDLRRMLDKQTFPYALPRLLARLDGYLCTLARKEAQEQKTWNENNQGAGI
jgi:hypothetical protein